MRRDAATRWLAMQSAAQTDGILLQVVSAYRPPEYQEHLIQRCLDKGEKLDEILSRIALPGFSEHQSGLALDLTTTGFEAVEEEFENSRAFQWLSEEASTHGFIMSYPRGNADGIIYEPWHWCYRPLTTH